ncbi:MAG: helix-turn-helix transcriptional regulator [Bacteroidota bacterium]
MSIPQLADKIGMTKRGLYSSIEKKTLTIITIEKIAEALDVPVSVFFDEQSFNWNNKELIAKNVTLDIRNQDLEENIKLLQDIIRTKKSLLRLIYEQLKNSDSDKFNQILKAINDSEKFDTEESKDLKNK